MSTIELSSTFDPRLEIEKRERVGIDSDPLVRDIIRLIGAKDMDPDERMLIRLAVAEKCKSELYAEYVRCVWPERPLDLPGDRELAATVHAVVAMGGTANRDDLDIAGQLGHWRYACWQAEMRDAARIVFVFHAWRTFRDACEYAPTDPTFPASKLEIEEFLRDYWGIDSVPDPTEERRVARLASGRPDILPPWLAANALPPSKWEAPKAPRAQGPQRFDFGGALPPPPNEGERR